MKNLIIVLICVVSYFITIPIILGIYSGCGGSKYIYEKAEKEELLKSHLQLIKEGNVIQGFPHDGWSVSYYPLSNSTCFYTKIYDYFYKWSVYYNFKWFDRC